MRAALPAGYGPVTGGLLQREPDLVGSVEWWLWWRECCGKRNPYRLGSPEWSLWRQRVQANPFKRHTPEWRRWRNGCCPLEEAGAEGLLAREPTFVGTKDWWRWWNAACRKMNPYPPNSADWQRWRVRVETNPFPVNSQAWRRWREGCCAAPPPAALWWRGACLCLVAVAGVVPLILYLVLHHSSGAAALVDPPPPPGSPPSDPPTAIAYTTVSHGCEMTLGTVAHAEHTVVTFTAGVDAHAYAVWIPQSVATCPEVGPSTHGGFVHFELSIDVYLPALSEPYVLCIREPWETGRPTRRADVTLESHPCPPTSPPPPLGPPSPPPPPTTGAR